MTRREIFIIFNFGPHTLSVNGNSEGRYYTHTRSADERTHQKGTSTVRMMARIAAAAVVTIACGYARKAATLPVPSTGYRFEPTDFSAGRWYKGNTHTHTSETDGDSSPEIVASWYKNHGYNFLVLSDHEILLDLSKVSRLEDSTFRFVPGEEITGKFGAKPVHLNGISISRVLMPLADTTAAATVQRTVDSVRAAGGVPQINHPNFGWALTEHDLMKVNGVNLFEIHNGHPLVNNEGGGDSPGMEAVWDYLLSHGKRIYGVASDDAHHFKAEFSPKLANPGKGWVTVRATKLDPTAIAAALDAGHFYASTGVELDSIVVKDQDMKVNISQYKNFKYTTEFVGDNGEILKTTGDNPATFHLTRALTYVRARIADSNGAKAWTQPVLVIR